MKYVLAFITLVTLAVIIASPALANTAPAIVGLQPSYTIPVNGALRLSPTVADPDGDRLTYYPSVPAHGVVVQPKGADSPTAVYIPADGYVGTDLFVYTVSDGKGAQPFQVVRVTIAPSACPPAQTVEKLPDNLNINGFSYGKR